MTTISQTKRAGNGPFLFVTGMIIVFLALSPVFAVKYSPKDVVISKRSHAVEKHGEDAVKVRDCLDKRGARQTWVIKNGRDVAKVIFVCVDEKGMIGMQLAEFIKGRLEEVTSFFKEEFTNLSQMKSYLQNGGAQCVKGCSP